MKTSIDLPDDLYRQVKARSALEGRSVREVATALFAAYVAGESPGDGGANAGRRPDAVHDAYQRRITELRRLLAEAGVTGGLVAQLQNDRR